MSLRDPYVSLSLLSLIFGGVGIILSLLKAVDFFKVKRILRMQLKAVMTETRKTKFKGIDFDSFLVESVLKLEQDSQEMYEKILQLAVNKLDQKNKEIMTRNFQSLSKLERKNFIVEFIENADIKTDIKYIASHCSNLGIMYQTHGGLDEAVQMYKKSLKLNEILDQKEDMARVYGNLGSVYQNIGDLNEAVQMYKRKLKLNKILDQKEDMARVYGNLGIMYQTIGELDKAVQMYKKSLKLNEILNRKEGMIGILCYLGFVYQTIGESDNADRMWRKSVEINETLRRREGMTEEYDNLDIIRETHRKLNEVRENYCQFQEADFSENPQPMCY
jgi:tetratricopeptide (TPR) repeat protein